MANPPPFTAFGTDAPDTASFNSLMASLMGDTSSRSGPPVESATASPTESSSSSSSAPSTFIATSSPTPTTFSTVPSSSRASVSSPITSAASITNPSNPTSSDTSSSATNAASTSNGGLTEVGDCHSISCSAGLKAAVAVPVVVGVLAIVGLLVFLARRRRRHAPSAAGVSEKPKKKWTRHLRIFSFDTELLTGGRFSSSNSMRSGDSTHHVARDVQPAQNPSTHSISEAAPPYRDAVSHAQQPSMTQAGAGVAAGGLAASAIPRSASRASAPPPYVQPEIRPESSSSAAPSSTRNPFSDAHLLSPADATSPFRDPSEDGRSTRSRPTISRNSSVHTGTSIGVSEAGSIREAQVGRHTSVISAGRTISNIRTSSQSPPNQSPPSTD